MKTVSTKYSFTKLEIEEILSAHICKLEGITTLSTRSALYWDISEGDSGPKEPMDCSPYEPTQVKEVTITL